MILFLGLLVASVAVAVMVGIGDYGILTKVIVAGLVGVSAVMQFDANLQAQVHFLVPFFMQLAVCGWYYFASQFE